MNNDRKPSLAAAAAAKSFGCASALLFAVALSAAPASAQTCQQTIDSINAAKTAQTDHEAERTALTQRIEQIEKGAKLFRRRLESGECRPAGASADTKDDQRPGCESLLKIVLEAQKGRASLESQIDELKRKATAAIDAEQKLVQKAAADGCPPYGTKPATKSATAAPAPKKAAAPKPRVSTQQREAAPPPAPRGGFSIMIGPGGGIGIGF